MEAVLQMESGYVLDFTDRTFSEFFDDLDVDIDEPTYCEDGTSKAKRLRRFLRSAEPELAGRALEALLEHRLASSSEPLRDEDQTRYRALVQRLSAPLKQATQGAQGDALPERSFDPALFKALPIDSKLNDVLCSRMLEAQKCLQVGAYLSTVILLGSVLEGLCEGFGGQNADEVKAAFRARYREDAPRPEKWVLFEWIAVLGDLGHLSPNIEKFGHALRDFRNYVHPSAEL
ncbi:MAG: hypothetical protein ABW061_17830, partial [Polyangiaceae bacterium]